MHDDRVVEPASVVAVEHHESAFAHVIPDGIADRVLGVELDVVGMAAMSERNPAGARRLCRRRRSSACGPSFAICVWFRR